MRGNDAGECRIFDGAFKYFIEVKDGLLMGVSELGKQGGRRWVAEGLCQGSRYDNGCIDRGFFVTGHWCGKNCTVLSVQLALVFGIYSW